MEKILLVEDDKKLSQLITEYLVRNGYRVCCETRGDKAVYRILHEDYALVILDINLPMINGFQVCQLVRKNYKGLILMLTARVNDEDHIKGLNLGADDYVSKPLSPSVLLAKIKALLRRNASIAITQCQLIFGKLQIDLEKRAVTLANKIIELKPTEYDLLVLLALNAGRSLSRNNIMQALRGIDYDGVDRNIDLRIAYLRRKLKDNLEKPYRIQTVRGKGYVLQPDAWDYP